MTTGIVSDGPARFETSESFQARRRELRVQVRLEFAPRLASAGFFRRLILRYQMHRAFHRAVVEISPSEQSLWFSTGVVINKDKVLAGRQPDDLCAHR
jgi:hypothetical protein